MPKQRASEQQPSPRIAKVISILYGRHIPIDPVVPAWQDTEVSGPTLAYMNFLHGRIESVRGRIPPEHLHEYMDPRYPDDDNRSMTYDHTAGAWVEQER